MIEVLKIGENTIHPGTYQVNRPKGHPVYLLLFVKSRGHFLIGDTWQTIEPVMAILYKPGQCHRYHGIDETYIDSWMHLALPDNVLHSHFPFGEPIAIPNPEDYNALIHLMYNEFYGSKPHREDILHSLATVLLTRLSDECDTASYPPIYYQLSDIRGHIYSHPEEDYSIEAFAESLSISPGHFHALYRKYFKTTCINDVVKSRLQSAADYLRATALSVEEISTRCGYHHTEHFIRQFKKRIWVNTTEI